jgi:membrane associated rhomboid family serine protease
MFLPIGVDPRPERPPVVTSLLILVNAALFLFIPPDDPGLIRWTMVPADLHWPTLFTNLFLHAGWAHLLGNMLFLWIFGRTVEDRLGHLGFLVFYFVGGLSADAAHLLSNPDSEVPTLGASGAISAVLGAFVVFYPRNSVNTFIWFGFLVRFIRTPAFLWIGFWFVQQVLLNLLTSTGGSGVAYQAHIGGFAAGALVAGALRALGQVWPSSTPESPPPPPTDGAPRRPFIPVPDEPDLEWLDDPGDSYSVLRLEEDPAVIGTIADVVQGLTGEPAGEVSRRLQVSRGMIARQIPLEAAASIQRELSLRGVPTAKILHNRANLPPTALPIQGVSWDDRSLRLRTGDQIVQVPWAAPFLWVAARVEGRAFVDFFLSRRAAFRIGDARTTPLTEVDPATRSEVSRDFASFARAIRRLAAGASMNDGIAAAAESSGWGRLDFPRTADYDDYVFWLYNLILARSSRVRG